ncbi:MAG: hypothetical protein ACOC5L_00220 [Halobacteriota archaeon]
MGVKEQVIENIKMECEAEKKKVERQTQELAEKLNLKEGEISKAVQELVDEGYLEYTKIKTICPVVNPKTQDMWGSEATYWG